ncbi:hypothetical protein [Agrococcus sp. SCSIO52902]|uniref:hypothetical protein n=1 Tax=Agrococcus sp. SCSIO52902 TaxID=2933290 RepID=UPI001FF33A31|nr:hypothetical protein [Agrococcus sp. SCSIO52902]UOW01514.1 hypothetical protein MU522_03620 [Agrococcus sp. SCSIO52902]
MRTPPRRRVATITLAAIAFGLATGLGACAQVGGPPPTPGETQGAPSPGVEPVPSGSRSPEPSAAPGSGPTATPTPAADGTEVATRNGTMLIRVPDGWQVDDRSGLEVGAEGGQAWANRLIVTGPGGERLVYADGPGVEPMPETRDARTGIVVRREIAGGLAAVAFWEQPPDGMFVPCVALLRADAEPSSAGTVAFHGVERAHALTFWIEEEAPRFATQAQVEAYLAQPAVAGALDVMATVRLDLVDPFALPADVGVVAGGTTLLPFETANGTSSMLVPVEWRIDVAGERVAAAGGGELWRNRVPLALPDGTPVLVYADEALLSPGASPGPQWRIGEVRPTADNWEAASWAVEREGGSPFVGVGLTDAGGGQWPHGTVCRPTLCRAFGSAPLTGDDVGAEHAVAWFDSDLEELMLLTVASLDALHDDPARMPPD